MSGDGGWIDVSSLAGPWVGGLAAVDLGEESVLLVQVDGSVLAYDNYCPHQGSRLSEGELDRGQVVCARHVWCFDARSGRGIDPPTASLSRYDCRVEGERIWVRPRRAAKEMA